MSRTKNKKTDNDPFFEYLIRKESFISDIEKIKKHIKYNFTYKKYQQDKSSLNFLLEEHKIPLKYFSPEKQYQHNVSILFKPAVGKVYKKYNQTIEGIFDYLMHKYKLTEEYYIPLTKHFFTNEIYKKIGENNTHIMHKNSFTELIEKNPDEEESILEYKEYLENQFPIFIMLKPGFKQKDLLELTKKDKWKELLSLKTSYSKEYNPYNIRLNAKTKIVQREEDLIWELHKKGLSNSDIRKEILDYYAGSGDDSIMMRDIKVRDIINAIKRLKKTRQ